jgi:hypothetical protein
MATVKEFVRKSPSEVPGPAHPCDDPGLSALQFLHAIMRDPSFPLSTRVEAASALLPYTESVPRSVAQPHLTIVIGGLPTEGQEHDNRNQQSNENHSSYSSRPFMTTPGPSYIEKTLERIPLSEIIEIVSRTPEHLLPMCACGHRMMFPCHPPCSSRRSSLN